MKNNLTGIIISALLHAGVLAWVANASNEPIKPIVLDNTAALTVSMFQSEIKTPPPALAPVKIVKKKNIEKPAPIKIATLIPIPKEKTEPKIKIKPIPTPIVKKKQKPKLIVKTKTTPEPKKVVKHQKVKKLKKKIVKRKPRVKKVKKPIRIVKKAVRKPAPIAKRKPQNKPRIVVVKQQPTAAQRRQVAARAMLAKRRAIAQQNRQRLQARVKPAPRYSKPASKQHAKRATPQRAKVKPSTQARRPSANTAQNAALSRQYKARLQQLIATNKRYPKRAKRRGHQGRVTISFKVRHSGIISDIKIIKGARNNDLNIASIKAIKKSSGKLAYLKGMNKKSLILTVTLSYKIT